MRRYFSLVYLMVLIQACSSEVRSNSVTDNNSAVTRPARIDTLSEYSLADSALVTHVKNAFYRSKSGHLYERTFAQIFPEGIDTIAWKEYFNGQIPQTLDPLSFEALDGWFAKDKNAAYYYRPVSGGMIIMKLSVADAKTFKVLAGDYRYAVDSKNVYQESEILEDLDPATLRVIRNKEGRIIKLISGSTHHNVKLVK